MGRNQLTGLAGALLLVSPAFAQAFVQSAGSTTGTVTAALTLAVSITPTTGNALFLGTAISYPRGFNDLTTVSCADGANTYTQDTSSSIGASPGGNLKQFHSFSITGGALTITCTFSQTQYASMQVMEFSGISGPKDSNPGGSYGTGTGYSLSSGYVESVNAAHGQANYDLVIGFGTTNYTAGAQTLTCSPNCGNVFGSYYYKPALPAGASMTNPVFAGEYCFDNVEASITSHQLNYYALPSAYPIGGATANFQAYECSGCTSATTPACWVIPAASHNCRTAPGEQQWSGSACLK